MPQVFQEHVKAQEIYPQDLESAWWLSFPGLNLSPPSWSLCDLRPPLSERCILACTVGVITLASPFGRTQQEAV